jgi:hypothetical protein
VNALPLRLIGLALLIIGLPLTIVGAVVGVPTLGFTRGAIATTATLTGYAAVAMDGYETVYTARFAFVDEDGVEVWTYADEASEEERHADGATVPILYQPGNPPIIRENDPWRLWGVTALFGGGGLLLLVLATPMLVFGEWVGRPQKPRA